MLADGSIENAIRAPLTQPVIHPQIWGNIPNEKIRKSIILAYQEQDAARDEQTKVAEKDQLGVFGLIQRTVGVEMVDTSAESILLANASTFTLTLVLVMASHVGDQIHGPAAQLLGNQVIGRGDGGFLGKLLELMKQVSTFGSVLLLGRWHKHHISLHVAGGFVMLAM